MSTKRVVVKVGTSTLTDASGRVDRAWIADLAHQAGTVLLERAKAIRELCFAAPDDRGDFFRWAEGQPLTRKYVNYRIASIVRMFKWAVEEELIPDNSILREFIGGSILKDFTIWKA